MGSTRLETDREDRETGDAQQPPLCDGKPHLTPPSAPSARPLQTSNLQLAIGVFYFFLMEFLQYFQYLVRHAEPALPAQPTRLRHVTSQLPVHTKRSSS